MGKLDGATSNGLLVSKNSPTTSSPILSVNGEAISSPEVDIFTNPANATVLAIPLEELKSGSARFSLKSGANYIKTEFINKSIHRYAFLVDESLALSVNAFTDTGVVDAYVTEVAEIAGNPGKKEVTINVLPGSNPGEPIYLSIANASTSNEVPVDISLLTTSADDLGEDLNDSSSIRTILYKNSTFYNTFESARNSGVLGSQGDKDLFAVRLNTARGNSPKQYDISVRGYNSSLPQALSVDFKIYDSEGKIYRNTRYEKSESSNNNIAKANISVFDPGLFYIEVTGGAGNGLGQYGVLVEEASPDALTIDTAPARPGGLNICTKYVGSLPLNSNAVVFVNDAMKRAVKFWSGALGCDTARNGRLLGKPWKWNDSTKQWDLNQNLSALGYTTPRKEGALSADQFFNQNIDRIVYWTIADEEPLENGFDQIATTFSINKPGYSVQNGDTNIHPNTFGVRIDLEAADGASYPPGLNRNQRIDDLTGVLIHELGHGLFFNSISMNRSGLVIKDKAAIRRFYGENAMRFYAQQSGQYPLIEGVPLENDTNHWSEEKIGSDIMTPFLSPESGANPVSLITLGALADLGYSVDYRYAQFYTGS